jgi:hypothetical protein
MYDDEVLISDSEWEGTLHFRDKGNFSQGLAKDINHILGSVLTVFNTAFWEVK